MYRRVRVFKARNGGLDQALRAHTTATLIVVASDDLWRLDDEIGQPLEDILRRTKGKVGDQLIVDRQVWGENKKVTDALGLMKVGDERAHQARLAYAGCQREAERWEVTLEVRHVGELCANRGECLRRILVLA